MKTSIQNLPPQGQRNYYKRVIEEFSERTHLKFLDRLRINHPSLSRSMTDEASQPYTKTIMLYYILPNLDRRAAATWPPAQIERIIDRAVEEYIDTLEGECYLSPLRR